MAVLAVSARGPSGRRIDLVTPHTGWSRLSLVGMVALMQSAGTRTEASAVT